MPNKTLLIYGAGGLGREVYDLASRNNDGKWNKILFVDDYCGGKKAFYGSLVMTLQEALAEYPLEQLEGVVAVGEPAVREVLFDKLRQVHIQPATLVDKTAIVSDQAYIGAGSVVSEFVILHTNAKLGENVLLQPYAAIAHDVVVGNHTVLSAYCSPGGHCTFGNRVFVGMQAAIMQGVSVGNDAIISMGAVVFRNIPEAATVVGNPARETRGNAEHKVF